MFDLFGCFHSRNPFTKNIPMREQVSFTTAFLRVNTLYTINNLIRLDRYSNTCHELLSKCDSIDHSTNNSNTLYRNMLSKIEFNNIGHTNTNIIYRQCVLHAKRLNVPLVHFSEFDDSIKDIEDIEDIECIESIKYRMEHYKNDKLNLLFALDFMSTIGRELKETITHDICDCDYDYEPTISNTRS